MKNAKPNENQTARQKRNGWNGGSWITAHKRLAIYLRDEFQCCYCGTDLHNTDRKNVSLDHIVPRSKGGNNCATNLITACKSCNSQRQNKDVQDYAPGGALDRIDDYRWRVLPIALAKSLISGKTGNRYENIR